MKRWILILSCLFLGVGAMAQRTINGVVVDETGELLSGVSVVVKGTNNGVVTDNDGKFSIDVPADKQILEFTFLGMAPIEKNVVQNMQVVLTLELQTLDDVVVTGMTKTDRRLFTGSADKLKADDIKLDGMADISRGLEGRAAGVSVQNISGTFGTAPKIRVRGATSIFGSSKPLWVVDGVIMEDVVEVDSDALSSGDASTLIASAIAGLNADDIESFDILKDGSATSIYGARAMAGVIVVTTKRGRAGVSKINYTGEFSYRLKPSYSTFNIMNSQDQMAIYQEMQQKGWLNNAEIANASESGVYGKMYDLINTGQLINDEANRNNYLRLAEYRNTDWFEELFNHNIVQNHSVSLSSGTEKSTYYASISAMVDPGWTKQSKVNRYTANFNALFNIRDDLSFNLISNGSYRKQRAPGTLSQNVDVVGGEVKRDFDINPYSYALNTSRALEPSEEYKRNYAPFNIMNELNNNYLDLNIVDLRFQGELKWKIIEGLEVSALGAIKYSTSSREHHITDFSNQAMAYRAMPTTVIRDKNPFLYTDPNDMYAVPISVLPEGGIYERTDNSMLAYDFRTAFTYNKTFNRDHIVNVYGGTEINSTDRRETWFRGWGMQYSMGEVPFYAYHVFKKGQEENSQYYHLRNYRVRSAAFFGNATYSYKRRYSINGTVRYEGTNKLGKSRNARWLPTWNIGGAWNAHEEDFFKSLESVLSNLTIRASYSLTGDRGPTWVTNSRAVINSYNPWRPYDGIGESGLQVVDLENSDLTYEKKHEFNLGTNIGFLNNRINLTFDWYTRNNYDLIGYITTQGIGGVIDKMGNVASMKSHGFEISLSTRNIVTKNFTWSTDFNYSYMKNEITELISKKRVIDMVSNVGFAREGYPVRSLSSVPFRGLNNEGLPTFLDQDGNVTTTGIYFQESEKLDFLEYSGSSDPTSIGSLGNIFTYKNFRLNVFITYSFGNVIRLDPVFRESYSDLSSMPKEFRNRWVVPGDENYTTIPTIASLRQTENDRNLRYAYNAYNYSTERVAKGDFIRMKEISLSYDFKQAVLKKIGVSNLSLKLQATNLFLIYADKKLNGQDPEFFNSGGVAAPVPKQFTFTLRLGL